MPEGRVGCETLLGGSTSSNSLHFKLSRNVRISSIFKRILKSLVSKTAVKRICPFQKWGLYFYSLFPHACLLQRHHFLQHIFVAKFEVRSTKDNKKGFFKLE
jgi:hypothetical protein